MVRRLDMLFLATIALGALLQNSAAQNTHTVGESSGWTVPSTANFYSTWAANQTFRVGDTLVFNFATGSHDVAGVTKANFDACNPANTQFLNTIGPANVVLNSTGEKYYICTFNSHCSAGQKLAINVSAATTPSPAPQPSSPAPPTATPSPSPRATPAPASTPTPAPASTPTPPAPASTPTPPPSSPRPSAPVSPPTASSPPPPPSPIAPTPSSTPPSSTSPPPSTTPSPPAPPPSSATSLGVAGLFATLLSLVVAVFLC